MRVVTVNTTVCTGMIGNIHSGQGCGNYTGNSNENYIGLAYNGLLGIISGSKVELSQADIEREMDVYRERPRKIRIL